MPVTEAQKRATKTRKHHKKSTFILLKLSTIFQINLLEKLSSCTSYVGGKVE